MDVSKIFNFTYYFPWEIFQTATHLADFPKIVNRIFFVFFSIGTFCSKVGTLNCFYRLPINDLNKRPNSLDYKQLFFLLNLFRWQQNLIGVMMMDIEYQEEDDHEKEVGNFREGEGAVADPDPYHGSKKKNHENQILGSTRCKKKKN